MAAREQRKILMSACLLGSNCRYDGSSKPKDVAKALFEAHRNLIVPVCPELMGGLPIPRTPSEIDTQAPELRVVGENGDDRTEAFRAGAESCLYVAEESGCRVAVMKAKSPSCGSGQIHDGSFTGVLVPGYGVAAELLDANGVVVIDENRLAELVEAGRTDDLFTATVSEDLED